MPRSRRSTRRLARTNPLARERALNALTFMRRGMSLRNAAREAHTTPATIQRYVPRAVVRTSAGRYTATKSDQYTRTLRMLTAQGQKAITVRGSRGAGRVAEYWAAVDHFLKTGSVARLRKFRGQSIRAEKVTYPFLTNPELLKRLAAAGEVQFEDLYALRG